MKPDQVNNDAFADDYDVATAATTDFPATTGTEAVTPPAHLVHLEATAGVPKLTHMAPVTDYVEVKTIEATTDSGLTTGPDGETATAGTTSDYGTEETGAPGEYEYYDEDEDYDLSGDGEANGPLRRGGGLTVHALRRR